MEQSQAPVVRIFVASPGDVAFERQMAEQVIEGLRGAWLGRLHVEGTLWEGLPVQPIAGFQEQIPDPAEYDITVFILWSRLGRPIGPPRDGVAQPTGTEYEFQRALYGVRSDPGKSILLFRKIAPIQRDLNMPREQVLDAVQQKEAVDRFFSNLIDSEGRDLAHHTVANASEFRKKLKDSLTILIEEIDRRRAPGGTPRRLATWSEGSPFRGLGVFDQQHAQLFFGRTTHIEAALAQLRRQASAGTPILLVFGRSGVGKSSFVRAGLAPTLTAPGVVEGIANWNTVLWEPSDAIGGNLLAGLARALLSASFLESLAQKNEGDKFEQLLRGNLLSALASLASELGKGEEKLGKRRILLLIDPLEEIFTRQGVTEEERAVLVKVLVGLVRSECVWILASVRSDFYERCAELPDLLELVEGGGQYHLPLPTRDQVEEMVKMPAAAAGLVFEELPGRGSLASAILNEAGSEADLLPLLQFTLSEVYRESGAMQSGILRFDAYDLLGGVSGSIATRTRAVTDALREELGSEFEPGIDTVFRALVGISIGESESVVRLYASMEMFRANRSARVVIEKLRTERLLILDKDDRDRPVVTISHESLLRRWELLSSWVEGNTEYLRIRSRVSAAAKRWDVEGRDADLLLPPGKPLVEAAAVLSPRAGNLDQLEREYLDASILADRRKRMQRRLIRRGVVAIMAILTIAALTLAAMSHRLYKQAVAATAEARIQKVVAVERSDKALDLLGFLLSGLAEQLDPSDDRDRGIIQSITNRTVQSYLDIDVSQDDPEHKDKISAQVMDAARALGRMEARDAQFQLAERALQIEETNDEVNLEVVVHSNVLMGEALRYLERFDDAHKRLLRAGETLATGALGRKDQLTAVHRIQLAGLLRSLRKLDDARNALADVIPLAREPKSGIDPATRVQAFLEFGNLLRDTGQLEDALQMYEKALETESATSGRGRQFRAQLKAQKSVVYLRQNRLQEAEQAAREAIALDEERWGPNHKWVAADIMKLVDVLIARGEYDEALRESERAVAIFRLSGAKDTFLARALETTATVHKGKGNVSAQIICLKECLEVRRERLKDHHPLTIQTAKKLIAELEAADRGVEAAVYRPLVATNGDTPKK